jgi:hypothetical protein
MTLLDAAPAAHAAARAPAAAAELAARIAVPRRLPPRYDGQPMLHLSNASYTRFLLCPEDWRRHYLLGERFAPSGSMFLGGRVDETLTAYYRRIVEHDERLTLDQVHDSYRDLWTQQLAAERDKRGIDWEDALDEQPAFQIGLEAIDLTFAELVPRIGHPVTVQRRLEFALAPGLEWTIQCWLDLETLRPDDSDELAPTIVDYKVKGRTLSQNEAHHDPQASLYLAGRWLQNDPAREFCFAQIGKPGRRRKQMTASLVATSRSDRQLRGALVRIAQAASQIVACYERFGPDEPWGFADPTSWKCSPRYCPHHAACPGGAGP